MSTTINYRAKHGINNLLKKARKFGKEKGVEVEGDNTSGPVKKGGILSVEGSYRIKGDNITIEVTKKPFIASWDMVKEEITKWLKENDVK